MFFAGIQKLLLTFLMGGQLFGAYNTGSTVTLLHCNGTDAGTTFTNSARVPHAFTAVGQAQLDTAQSQWGGASCLFDGTGDRLEGNTNNHADFDFGTGDFFVGFFVRFNALPAADIVLFDNNGTAGLRILRANGGPLTVSTGSAERINAGWSPGTNEWFFVGVHRRGGAMRAFMNSGQIGGTNTSNDSISTTTVVTLGGDSGSSLDGWMDDIIIAKGTALIPFLSSSNDGIARPTQEFDDPGEGHFLSF